MDREFMRAFYREFREHAYDEAVKDSDEYKEMRDVRHKVEDELTEMLGGTHTSEYKKFDDFISAYADEYDVMLEEVYLLGAADRERMLR